MPSVPRFKRPPLILAGGITTKLAALAADPKYDPDAYRHGKLTVHHWCGVCGTRYAPGGLCGYCVARVRAIRSQTPASN
jgi:hypothetical protein